VKSAIGAPKEGPLAPEAGPLAVVGGLGAAPDVAEHGWGSLSLDSATASIAREERFWPPS
jgi:hypothetical protein